MCVRFRGPLAPVVIFLKNVIFWKISEFHFGITLGLSGPPESIPTMLRARAECRRTLSRPCGPMPTLPLPPRAD